MKYVLALLISMLMLTPAAARHRQMPATPACVETIMIPCYMHGLQTYQPRTTFKRVSRGPRKASGEFKSREGTLLPHPAGCPHRAFCGCGLAVEIYGYAKRELWLAANWFKFPRAAPAPGMVGVRPHHVFRLVEQVSGNLWLVSDYNSGGHLSRRHVRDIAGYTIVNPS